MQQILIQIGGITAEKGGIPVVEFQSQTSTIPIVAGLLRLGAKAVQVLFDHKEQDPVDEMKSVIQGLEDRDVNECFVFDKIKVIDTVKIVTIIRLANS